MISFTHYFGDQLSCEKTEVILKMCLVKKIDEY